MIDTVLNIFIFFITASLIIFMFRKDGQWVLERGKSAFRFYTVQSNVLCAVVSLLMALASLVGPVTQWVWILKYIGTAAVIVTMLTVFLFLAPSIGKDWFQILLKGADNMFMHLLTPLMALVSFCLLEKRGMTFLQSLFGMLPVVLYGPLYLYKIVYAPEDRRWDDFYGFNKGGKWPIAFAGMILGSFLICLGIMVLQNL